METLDEIDAPLSTGDGIALVLVAAAGGLLAGFAIT
jgi:hypothetical protein